ncbi:hypothetical protein BWQ96_09865 [Gracilariopsis chorda]|uniref:Uncharacterized protein n=1 Tax=Gracilariopsis chorda TaxID=448386 RepID=A0A2V3IEA9_9FLOR|nr:hypothetical protein BWQ96_09865 [Gracilariopsis chorda]|eukprot:PXF40425.1 hypothetical protein BWQ96_09865 [Gracilariopsis chorda]
MGRGRKRYRWEIPLQGRQLLFEHDHAEEEGRFSSENRYGEGAQKRARKCPVERDTSLGREEERAYPDVVPQKKDSQQPCYEIKTSSQQSEFLQEPDENESVKIHLEYGDCHNGDYSLKKATASDENGINGPDLQQCASVTLEQQLGQSFEVPPLSPVFGIHSLFPAFSDHAEHSIELSTHSTEATKSPIQEEYESLAGFIYNAVVPNESQRAIERLLKVAPISSPFSYRSLISYAFRKAHVEKSFVRMCRRGHVACLGRLESVPKCPCCDCSLAKSPQKYWFMKPPSALKALFRVPDSFRAIMEGFLRAKNSISNSRSEVEEHDYYHGSMFQTQHSALLEKFTPHGNDLFIFLTLSSDGFECSQNCKGEPILCWPVISTILKFAPHERSRASNCLFHSVSPSKHDLQYFDTFMTDIVSDLKELEKGIMTLCHDGNIRKVHAFVRYFIADWPAPSKVLGYVGHTAKLFCRFCMKKRVYMNETRCLCAVPKPIASEASSTEKKFIPKR